MVIDSKGKIFEDRRKVNKKVLKGRRAEDKKVKEETKEETKEK